MKQQLRFLMLTLLCAVAGIAWGETKSVTISGTEAHSGGVDPIDITCAKGGGTANPNSSGGVLHLYQPASGQTTGNSITFSSQKTITSIVFTFSDGMTASNGAFSEGTYNSETFTWTGSTNVVTLAVTGKDKSHRIYISEMVVYYQDSNTPQKTDVATISPIDDTSLEVGDKGNFTATITPATGLSSSDYTVSWSSTGDALSVSESGSYTALAAGTATVTVTVSPENTTDYNAVTATFGVTINPANVPITSYIIDFESDLSLYQYWEFSNIGIGESTTQVPAHGGSKYGINVNNNGNGTKTASIKTKQTIATPQSLTCYVSKQTTNTTASTWKIQVSEDGTDWTDVESTDAKDMAQGEWKEFTADLSDYTDVYVRVYYSGSNAIRLIDDLTLNTDAPAVAKPVFSVEEGEYTEAKEVEITCSTEGATIYYSIDGSEPSIEYTAPITISTTTTLKAIAKKGEDKSKVAAATYTIVLPITISEVRTKETGTSVFTQGIVTSCVGTTAFIQDNTAAICVYGDNNLVVGNEIKVQGTLSNYKGLLEITNPTYTIVSTGNTVTPEVKSIAEINNGIQGKLIQIENATVTSISDQNATIAQGNNTIEVRGITEVNFALDDIIILTGNIGCYNDVVQIVNPRDITKVTPLVALDPDTPNPIIIPYTGATDERVYIIDNGAADLGIVFYDADKTTPLQSAPSWYIYEGEGFDATCNVMYSIPENTTSEERTVYLKVWGAETQNAHESERVYTDLITITQEAYVATKDYSLFSGDLEEGDYVIYYNGKAMNNTVSSNRLQYEKVTPVNDVITTDNEAIVWHIAKSGDYWTIQSLDNDKYAAATSSNNQATVIDSSTDDKAKWTVSGTGQYEFVNKTKSSRFLRYNEGYGFGCYAESTGGALRLYKYVEPSFTFTISGEATDGENNYYATIADLGEGNYEVTGGVSVRVVQISKGQFVATHEYSEGTIIAGDKAYLVKSSTPGSYSFPKVQGDPVNMDENMLHSTGEGNLSADEMKSILTNEGKDPDNYRFYKLSLYNGKIGFFYGAVGGGPFTYGKGHQAFLAVPVDETHGTNAFFFDGTTAISEVLSESSADNATYTLSGVRVDSKNLPKGIYIVNGKKMVIK